MMGALTKTSTNRKVPRVIVGVGWGGRGGTGLYEIISKNRSGKDPPQNFLQS